MISVLLATYNGENYIDEQLTTLMSQTRKPDEVVLIDDCSTDNTVKKINQFIENNNLSQSWFLYKNKENCGWKRNFKNGLKLLKGEYIFFCDQDDIWFANKIEKTMSVLENNPKINVVGTSAVHIYNDGSKVTEGDFDKCIEIAKYKKNKSGFVEHPLGCTMLMRRKYIEKVIKYYSDDWAHDEFFWRYAVVEGTGALIHDSFMLHRVSGANVTSKKIRNIGRRIEIAESYEVNYSKLLSYAIEIDSEQETIECVKYYVHGNRIRKKYLEKPNLFCFLMLLFKYRKIYYTNKQFCGDVVLSSRIYTKLEKRRVNHVL